jgi:hypothetical protein
MIKIMMCMMVMMMCMMVMVMMMVMVIMFRIDIESLCALLTCVGSKIETPESKAVIDCL